MFVFSSIKTWGEPHKDPSSSEFLLPVGQKHSRDEGSVSLIHDRVICDKRTVTRFTPPPKQLGSRHILEKAPQISQGRVLYVQLNVQHHTANGAQRRGFYPERSSPRADEDSKQLEVRAGVLSLRT